MVGVLLILLVIVVIELFVLRKRVSKLEKFREDILSGTELPADHGKEAEPVVQPSLADISGSTKSSPNIPGREKTGKKAGSIPPVKPTFSSPKKDGLSKKRYVQRIKNFFTTGNVVLKVGVIIFFFGVSFLLKYAAEHSLVPVELRLVMVALGGISLLAAGWYFREKQTGYGLVLQGAGVGVLYLTVFASSRLYDLLPYGLSLAVMVGIVVSSCVLALLQNSASLASFGISGGFLAPVLMSTGGGSHVMLFGYYSLLNCGIIAIAFFRSWRIVNLVGFAFTFGISAIWGYRYYQPQIFETTEPFLLFFFLLYVTISVLFAHKQPVRLKGFVDGPLVFGLPIIFFGLQASLVEQMEYGVALSALLLGLFYCGLASYLWKRAGEGMKVLTEAFLALGLVFGSLAIPFAVEGNVAGSAWALEGGAMVWVGMRQQRVLARLFGVALQTGAGVLALFSSQYYLSSGDLVFLNKVTMSGLFIAAGGLFSAWVYNRYSVSSRKWEKYLRYLLLGWGLIWWTLTFIRDIEIHSIYPNTDDFVLLFFGVSALVFTLLFRFLRFSDLRYPLLCYMPIVVLFFFSDLNLSFASHCLSGYGIISWPVAIGVLYYCLKVVDGHWPVSLLKGTHLFGFWLVVVLLASELAWTVDHIVNGSGVWPFTAFVLLPGCTILLFQKSGERIGWPVARLRQEYQTLGIYVLLVGLFLWCLLSFLMSGDPKPIVHIPVVNPLTITQVFILFVFFSWLQRQKTMLIIGKLQLPVKNLQFLFGVLVFLWLNSLTARAVSLFFSVPFESSALYTSVVFQAAVSILWSVCALSITVWSTREGHRNLWFIGGGLLACVVIKLFVVDLSSAGTIGRIVSFLVVGLLMLLVGYFSPIPPREKEKV